MPTAPRSTRLLLAVAAVAILTAGLLVRGLGEGAWAQRSGTALYASLVWVGVRFTWPRLSPPAAGSIAIGFCWLVELSQLTGIPAALSARSVVARLVLGAQFDLTDMLWYPVGVVPLVVVHRLITQRRAGG